MSNIALKDILISARQESYRMRHFYLGAEHLFIALLEIKGGLAASIVQERGLTPEYVIDAIRRKIGKGSKHRLWAGTPNTPRADRVLDIARDLAVAKERKEINERDLLIALLDEADSAPIRVLQALGLGDSASLKDAAKDFTLTRDSQHSFVKIDYGPHFETENPLSKDQLLILRRMFHGYAEVRVERRLPGSYTGATLLVVTPLHGDSREDAAVVVKIDHVDTILDEAQRYESHVKTALPPLTARLEERPVAPETSDMAGIKYTLIAGNNRETRDLRATLNEWQPAELGDWIKTELYPAFGRIWWQQNRPYRFQAWREYDWMLPPVLTLEFTQEKHLPPNGHVLKFPIRRSRLNALEYGDIVAVENFVVQKVYPERNAIQLAVSSGTDAALAYKIEVRGLDLTHDTFYRGEVIESITGRVWETRNQHLIHYIRELEPDFDLENETIPINNDALDSLPNPIKGYEAILDSYVNGSLCTIHGDLHLGNIMIGPNNSAFLIDFAHTRDGHTVFDWANLEISLLSDLVTPVIGESWEDMRAALPYIIALNGNSTLPDSDSPIGEKLAAVYKVREIARDCLAATDAWSEYYTALALCSLRATTWHTMTVPARRLMFLVAGMSMRELRTRFRPTSEGETPSPDETDINELI